MNQPAIDRATVAKRVKIIERPLERLRSIRLLSAGKFTLDENFAIAEHYLRYALEATFDICSHLLSRIPGVAVDGYKQMALEMGKQDIVSMDFAERQLQKMAGYRNRLTHFYLEVTPQEMYDIIQNHLDDFSIFMKHIKKLL